MRPSKAEEIRHRRIVAAGTIAGKGRREIAKAAGVRPDQVYLIAKHPATRMLIEELREPERDRIRKLAHKAVSAVERELETSSLDAVIAVITIPLTSALTGSRTLSCVRNEKSK